MYVAVHTLIDIDGTHSLTRHAWQRMGRRGISAARIRRVLEYGRVMYSRGCLVHVVGRKEVKRFARDGVELSDVEGVHVVCSRCDKVVTVYRSRDLSGLREWCRGRGRRRR